MINWSILFDTIYLPGAPSADGVDDDGVDFGADFLDGVLALLGNEVDNVSITTGGGAPVLALLGIYTDGEVDDVSTTTEGEGGSVG